MKKAKSNLPAKREINIFTSAKNVDANIINEIAMHLKQAKKIQIKNADGFQVGIYKEFINLNVDTVLYMIEHYGFEKHSVRTDWDDKIYISTSISPKDNIRIQVHSEKWKINFLPKEAKQVINL